MLQLMVKLYNKITQTTKFLRVVKDEKLKWSDNCHYIKGKISRGLGMLSKAK